MPNFELEQLILLTPEFLLALVGIIILLLPKNTPKLACTMASAAIAVDFFMCMSLWGVDETVLGTYDINLFTTLCKMMFLGFSFVVVIGSANYAKRIKPAKEYFAFILFATLGLIAIPSASDFITLFVAFELVSISTYALPLVDPTNLRGREAALKYFLSGAFSSALVLYGMSWVYGYTGTTSIVGAAEVVAQVGAQPILMLAFLFMVAGFGYKMALVPFHLWSPDTYEGSSSPVSGFLAGVTKKGAFIAVFKLFLITFVAMKTEISFVLAIVAMVTMTVGNVVALHQTDIKRMMSYSSVAHAGNILVGIAIANGMGLMGTMVYIVAHGVMTLGAFFAISYVFRQYRSSDIECFHGLAKTNPWTALGFAIILFSLAGIPPLLGFWGKMIMVIAAFQNGGWYIVLAVSVVLNTAISLVYYANLVRVMYMKEPYEGSLAVIPEHEQVKVSSCFVALWSCAIFLIVFGLFPDFLSKMCLLAVNVVIW